jgi:DNA-binding SARP family transcriptional activator
VFAKLTSTVRRTTGATVLALLLAAPPWALLTYLDQPVPDHLPSWAELGTLLTSPLTDQTLGALLTLVCWLAWASFAWSVIAELLAALTGLRLPQPRALAPARGLAALLVALITGSVLATTAQAAAPALARPAEAATMHNAPQGAAEPATGRQATLAGTVSERLAVTAPRQAPPAARPVEQLGQLTLVAAGTEYTYTVKRDDTLSEIAEECLGDANRWPEIYALNRGTHFTKVGGTLTNPHLIYPGWTLNLPDDATPPTATKPPAAEKPAPPVTPPSASAPPVSSTAPVSPPAASPSTSPATPAPSATTSAGSDDGVVGPLPTDTRSASATPSATAPATTPPPATPTGTVTPGPSPTSNATTPNGSAPADRPDGDRVPGVSLLSGSWLDLGLAAAIAAAVALVWAHRRRRYTPRPLAATPRTDDLDLTPMPPTVVQVSRGLRRPAPDAADSELDDLLTTADDPENREGGDDSESELDRQHDAAGAVPVVPALEHPLAQVWPPAGVGLTGPGATAAARGFLAAGLATGGLDDPDQRTHVIMPSATAATLLGTHAVALPDTPRLTVTAGLDDAIDLIDTHTLHRARLAYQQETDDVAALRAADPTEDLPPILLIADITSRHERARVAALLTQGQRLDIHGVLLGTWPDGNTVHVDHDGTTTPADTGGRGRHGAHPADIGRLSVLDPTETADIVSTLAESHTGRPQRPAPTEPPAPTVEPAADHSAGTATGETTAAPSDGAEPEIPSAPGHAGAVDAESVPEYPTPELHSEDETIEFDEDPKPDDKDEGDAAAAEGDVPGGPVPVAVLGGVTIIDADPQRKPRPQALELLVYLAVHDGSATVDAILEDLLPDALARKAARRLHTYVSDLRGVLRHNGGPGVYVTHPKLRYALSPDTVDVDLWRMRAAITAATRADTPEQRISALRLAVDAYRGPLADGYDFLWIEPHREAVRREALDAVSALVDALTGQPEQQLVVLEPAVVLHPWAEHLYQAAMRAHHQLGHVEAIRELRRAVTNAAADLDAEPGDDTIALADRLVADLHTRGGRAPLRPHPGATP